jgi:hypothetical protein
VEALDALQVLLERLDEAVGHGLRLVVTRSSSPLVSRTMMARRSKSRSWTRRRRASRRRRPEP